MLSQQQIAVLSKFGKIKVQINELLEETKEWQDQISELQKNLDTDDGSLYDYETEQTLSDIDCISEDLEEGKSNLDHLQSTLWRANEKFLTSSGLKPVYEMLTAHSDT
jgi:DNA integrity scanning protein DisA with diadenylate cyclase activity